MIKAEKIVFIYLGDSFPKYAESSLQLALQHSGMNVHIIGNKVLEKSAFMNGVRFSSVEEFYNPKIFRDIAKKATLPHEFRNGFWLKTLERFFVMYQYMESQNVSKIFHAELDQLLFGCANDRTPVNGSISIESPYRPELGRRTYEREEIYRGPVIATTG